VLLSPNAKAEANARLSSSISSSADSQSTAMQNSNNDKHETNQTDQDAHASPSQQQQLKHSINNAMDECSSDAADSDKINHDEIDDNGKNEVLIDDDDDVQIDETRSTATSNEDNNNGNEAIAVNDNDVDGVTDEPFRGIVPLPDNDMNVSGSDAIEHRILASDSSNDTVMDDDNSEVFNQMPPFVLDSKDIEKIENELKKKYREPVLSDHACKILKLRGKTNLIQAALQNRKLELKMQHYEKHKYFDRELTNQVQSFKLLLDDRNQLLATCDSMHLKGYNGKTDDELRAMLLDEILIRREAATTPTEFLRKALQYRSFKFVRVAALGNCFYQSLKVCLVHIDQVKYEQFTTADFRQEIVQYYRSLMDDGLYDFSQVYRDQTYLSVASKEEYCKYTLMDGTWGLDNEITAACHLWKLNIDVWLFQKNEREIEKQLVAHRYPNVDGFEGTNGTINLVHEDVTVGGSHFSAAIPI
jgi:hypothetical protein